MYLSWSVRVCVCVREEVGVFMTFATLLKKNCTTVLYIILLATAIAAWIAGGHEHINLQEAEMHR